MTDWFAGVTTEAALTKRWKQLANQYHPDRRRGGDSSDFLEIKQQYQTLKKRLKAPLLCPTCGGEGTRVVSRGFFSLPLRCPACRGSGFTSK